MPELLPPRRVPALLAVALVLAGCSGGADEPDDAKDDVASGPGAPARPEAETEPDPDPDPEPEDEPPPEPPGEVRAFEDPDELAEALATAETALADPETPDVHVERWAGVHQQAYRDLVANPDWQEQARERVPGRLHPAFDATLHAGTQLWELTEPRDELPDWRIEPPPPVEELRAHYDAAEAEFGVPWNVLAAVHLVETRFGRIHGDSHAGAQGPMQFMPGTWDAYGEGDVHDPRDAIMAAGRYLAASGAPGDLRAALFAYNRSERYVEAILAHAEVMEQYDHYLEVYHGWRVYYRTVDDGDVVLEEGYGA
jgi:hypothetical protein